MTIWGRQLERFPAFLITFALKLHSEETKYISSATVPFTIIFRDTKYGKVHTGITAQKSVTYSN